tara:strand:+ start:9900 stop:10349 length:450 start_codon:yes stop_codon:yes gene_type:complete
VKDQILRPDYHPDSFYHWTEMKVRFRDLDPLNHVNNAVFNSYFEEARIDLVNNVAEFRNSMSQGKSFVLVHMELDYLKPILYGETILIGSALDELGNSSIKGFQAIYEKESKELKAVCKTTGVWFDLNTQRPTRIPKIENPEKYLFKKP